jgi:cation diffusion facilitator CzcD-associated flavoprotein CzcO
MDRTAHDVADDMLEAGLASVTMVQRTPTCEDLRPLLRHPGN